MTSQPGRRKTSQTMQRTQMNNIRSARETDAEPTTNEVSAEPVKQEDAAESDTDEYATESEPDDDSTGSDTEDKPKVRCTELPSIKSGRHTLRIAVLRCNGSTTSKTISRKLAENQARKTDILPFIIVTSGTSYNDIQYWRDELKIKVELFPSKPGKSRAQLLGLCWGTPALIWRSRPFAPREVPVPYTLIITKWPAKYSKSWPKTRELLRKIAETRLCDAVYFCSREGESPGQVGLLSQRLRRRK